MMRRRLFPVIVVAIILLLCACSQDDAMRGRTVSIALEGVAQPGARTILPDGYVQPTKFDVTLTAVEGNGETRTYKDLPLSAGSLTLTDVKLGTYTVSIDGKTAKDAIVMKGKGHENLVVTTTEVSSVTVTMDVVSDSGTGYIKVVFDWTAAKDNERLTSYLKSGDGLTFKMYDVATGKELGSTEAIKGSNKTSATLTATIDLGIAGKNEFDVYYKLYSGETLITDKLRRSTAHVYAGNTSVDDEDEIIITDDDVSWGVNVRNASWAYVERDSTKIQISWDNVFSRGTQIFDHVVVSWQRQYGTGDKSSATAYFHGTEKTTDGDFNFAADSATGSITISNLESDVPYSVSIQAFQTNGMVSPDTVMDFTIQTKVIVNSITTTQSEFSTTAGESIDINWTVNPSDASITEVKISGTNEAFEVTSKDDSTVNGNAKVKVNKAGVNTLTVESSDPDSSASATYTVKAKLTTPTDVKAEKKSEGILVSWNEVNDAAGYSVQKYKNGSMDGEAVLVTDGTSWTDTNVFSSQSYHYTVTAYNKALNQDQDDFTADSASATTDAVPMPQSSIAVVIPSSGSKLEINITAKDDILALYEDSSLTFSAVGEDGTPIEGMKYAWYFNNKTTPFSTSATVDITKAYENDLENTQTSGVQILKLVITTKDMTYSGSVKFYNITTPEESIAITLPEGYSDPDSVVRVASETYDETEGKAIVRQIKLKTKFTPAESTLKNVWYTSSDTGIATVSSDGTVTFTNTKFGTVEITARSASGKTDTVTFDVYKPTVTSALMLLNGVNTIMRQEFVQADSHFGGDWNGDTTWIDAQTSPGTGIGFNFTNASDNKRETGKLSVDVSAEKKITIDGIGQLGRIYTDSDIPLIAEQRTYLGTSKLETIGNDSSSDLIVELPYNQGPIHIHYNNVVVYNGETNRGGTYVIKSDKTLGYDMEVIKTEIPDGDGVTKVLY